MITATRTFTLLGLGAFGAGDIIHAKSEEHPDGLEQAQIDKLIRDDLARDSEQERSPAKSRQPDAPAGVTPGASKGKNAAPKVKD